MYVHEIKPEICGSISNCSTENFKIEKNCSRCLTVGYPCCSFIHPFMFIRTNSMHSVDRITRDMQDRKAIQDSYNCPKSLH